ncbi:MAG: transporter associated domain-containing protein [Gammaproteobacteria bacterium]
MASDDELQNKRSWLERISYALLGEPKDREQLVSLLRDAEQRELLNSDALSMIEGVLHVSETRVSDIMIPKAQMVIMEKEKPFHELVKVIIESAHSRFPVMSESHNEVLGILLAKDVIAFQTAVAKEEWDSKFNLKDLIRPAVFVPESKRLDILLKEFRKSRNHIAIVVDEYGSIAGLVTIEDVLEQIVGDIEDEHDIDEDNYIRKHSNNRFSVQAITPIDEFNEYFRTNFSDDEFDTVGGLVLQAFGHLPKRGEIVELNGFTFKVLKANNRRIQSLSVIKPNIP